MTKSILKKPVADSAIPNEQDIELATTSSCALAGISKQSDNALTIMPIHKELTTQESAKLLNVSGPYLMQLLEEGKIPFRNVGTRRKILFQDLMEYKKKDVKERSTILDSLVEETQKLSIGY